MVVMRKPTPEGLVKSATIRYLRFKGWWTQINVQQGFGNVRGRPDLEALKRGITIYIECKAGKGKLSRYQIQYISRLRAYGAFVLVVHSTEEAMRDIDRIEERLWPGENTRRLI